MKKVVFPLSKDIYQIFKTLSILNKKIRKCSSTMMGIEVPPKWLSIKKAIGAGATLKFRS